MAPSRLPAYAPTMSPGTLATMKPSPAPHIAPAHAHQGAWRSTSGRSSWENVNRLSMEVRIVHDVPRRRRQQKCLLRLAAAEELLLLPRRHLNRTCWRRTRKSWTTRQDSQFCPSLTALNRGCHILVVLWYQTRRSKHLPQPDHHISSVPRRVCERART